MFFVQFQRVVKVNTGSTAQYAPRTSNHEKTIFSGPFKSERVAERAAVAGLSTHTCLAAQVVTLEQVKERVLRDKARGVYLHADPRVELLKDHGVDPWA